MIAVGIIDTMGYISTIEALDVCLKTADVQLVSNKKGKGGMVSVIITGDVGSVTSAIEAGVAATQKLGGYHSHTIIARIDKQTGKLFGGPPSIPDPSSDDPSPDDRSPDDPSQKPEPKSSLAATESASPKTVIAKRKVEAPSTTSQASQAKPAETPPMKRTGKGTKESSDAKISQASESSKSKKTDKPSRASQSSRKKLPKKKPPKKK